VNFTSNYYRALVAGQLRGPWPTLQRWVLRALSVPYGLAVAVRNGLYERGWKISRHANVPVVSVGNLTLGGTGKTPCVEYVARFFRDRQIRVAVLSRGYGAAGGRNDEALVLEENLPDVPHLQGVDRVSLAAIAVEELESELLVLDDGFQHRRLARDLDIVLLDATNPWGHGHVFPRGELREGKRNLRRAGVVVLTRCDQVATANLDALRAEVGRMAPGVPVACTRHAAVGLVDSDGNTASFEQIQGQSVAAFCGIGNPEAFRRTLLDLGANVVAFRSYADHHAYQRQDVDDLGEWMTQHAPLGVAVTTQKDLVKLRISQLGGRPLWALAIRLQVDTGREELDRKLEAVLT
jgi:tetraacyldisaccharide 4'-kinase